MGPFDPPVDSSSVKTPPVIGNNERGWEPGSTPPATGSTPAPYRPATPRPENIAGINPNNPPTANIRSSPTPVVAPPANPDPPQSRLPANRVPNFVLSDLSGSDWEFRYARDRLVLLDFWSTTCRPCMRAVPAIKKLQSDYGASGLEVVAVACEPDAPFNQRARQVDEVARRKEVNYKVYMERDRHVGEVQRLFNVQWVPTLVLLDRQGNILWRGGATDTDLERVDQIIKAYLTNRN
jgi:thiol-disulfide isomerase/thioredoxin